MSSWKLVEAVAESEAPKDIQEEEQKPRHYENNDYRRSGTTGRGGRGGRGAGGRSPNNSQPYRSKADRSYYAYLAVQQIDSIFNPDSLCIDTYIRTYMDEEGYVPISLVCAYQNVVCYGCSYYDIVNKLKEVAMKSKYYEMDTENECLRLKNDWKKFLMPNPFGGFGLPRYVKHTVDGQTVYYPYGAYGYADGNEYSNYDQAAEVEGGATVTAAEEATPAAEASAAPAVESA